MKNGTLMSKTHKIMFDIQELLIVIIDLKFKYSLYIYYIIPLNYKVSPSDDMCLIPT